MMHFVYAHPQKTRWALNKGSMGAQHSHDAAYRNNKRGRGDIEEALELLSDNNFSNLSHQRFPGVKGTLSWARLGEWSVQDAFA